MTINTTSQFASGLQSSLDHPVRGVVGLVDDLLQLCQEQGLQVDWDANCCRVISVANGAEEVIHSPVRKSVFRAILARLATLCNENSPNSVSPYGGQGILAVGTNPASLFRLSFANTSHEQWFKLRAFSGLDSNGEADPAGS